MLLKKDNLIFLLPVIECLISIGIMSVAISNCNFIYLIFSLFFAWQCGWGLKSILETLKLRDLYISLDNSKFIEHWKVFYLIGFLIVSMVIGLFSLSLSSYILGFISLLFAFFAGQSFRMTAE